MFQLFYFGFMHVPLGVALEIWEAWIANGSFEILHRKFLLQAALKYLIFSGRIRLGELEIWPQQHS